MLTQLSKLGQMNQAGLINDAEFTAAKAKLLNI
ncbi:MAG TPA: SHOCT domain-containing protein [Microbacteriaceae bacterium]